MKAPTPFRFANRSIRSISGSRNGVALLVVLAFILLLSILVASYLSFSGLDRLSTASYSKSIQAQEVAQGGLQDIIADLQQEIVAGSQSATNAATFTQGSTTVYVPTTNLTIQPARLGYTDPTTWTNDVDATRLPPTFVRESRASAGNLTDFNPPLSTTLYPGTLPLNRASASSSGTASVNGRVVSNTVWNKPGLLAAPGASVPSDFVAPDWVYVTRTGSQAIASNQAANYKPSTTINALNPNPINGRYAYVIYDEGALLDANVAGYPAAAAATTASFTMDPTSAPTNLLPFASMVNSQAPRGKAYSLFADLTQLPGFLGNSGLVDTFVNWRNAGGVAYAQNYMKATVPTGIPFLGSVVNYAQNGFLQFLGGGAGAATDSPLLSRQDLLNYFAKIDPNNTGAAKAVPYLGTYSRATSAPTWLPRTVYDVCGLTSLSTTKKATPDYGAQAETTSATSTVANLDMANVRYPQGGTITHYVDDQTSATPTVTYTVGAGDPLLLNRFSLARIGWLSSQAIGGSDPNGANPNTGHAPSATFATAIQACFGLVWGTPGQGAANGGNPCWSYVGSKPGAVTPVGAIETLNQVAAENREPNFFEMLKAAILSGSLGDNAGPAGWTNGTTGTFAWRDFTIYYVDGLDGLDAYSFDRKAPGSETVYGPARIPDVQIMKIGADIIDQYDADSYPTAIYFPYTGPGGVGSTGSLTSAFDATVPSTLPDHMEFGEAGMVFGDENLPEMDGVYTVCGTGTTNNDDGTGLNGWYQPQVWNPHQMPTTWSTVAPPPVTYQVRAYGQTSIYWNKRYTPAAPDNPSEPLAGNTDVTSGYPPPNGQEIQLQFTSATPPQSIYASPQPITSTMTGITATPLDPGASTVPSHMQPNPNMSDYSYNKFVAFWLGDDPTYVVDGDYSATGSPQKTQIYTESIGNTFSIGWMDSNNGFHPYSFMTNPVGWSYGVIGVEKDGSPVETAAHKTNTGSANPGWTDGTCHYTIDCRTERFSVYGDWACKSYGTTLFPNNGPNYYGCGGITPDTTAWGKPVSSISSNTPQTASSTASFWWEKRYATLALPENFEVCWETNNPNGYSSPSNGFPQTPSTTYYLDVDGMVRPGDGYYGTQATGDGVSLFLGTVTYSGHGTYTGWGNPTGGTAYALGDAVQSDLGGNIQHARRPVILNRPFRSVGELGYAFRDEPFKTLDFFTQASADAALLDVFSLTDESKVSNSGINSTVAGQVNLSNASLPVLEAILSGGAKKEIATDYNFGNSAYVPSTDVNVIAQALAAAISPSGTNGPLANRADLVLKLCTTLQSGFVSSVDKGNKANLESPVRALANVANTRTWNLLIDVIAQSGHLTNTATALDNFSVEGERRYWLHLAIDRYTGKVLSQQLEPVYE